MLGMFGTGPGQSHLIGIFFDSLATDLELPRTSVAAAYGSATLVAAFLLPQVGKLVDRFGAAGLMWILVLCLGLAAVMFSMAFNWIYIAIGFGFLRFLGQGSMMMTCANLVSPMVRSKMRDCAGFDVPRFSDFDGRASSTGPVADRTGGMA